MPINKGYLTARTDKASDEVYTPAYAVRPIVKYLDMLGRPSIVWCPFDMSFDDFADALEPSGLQSFYSEMQSAEKKTQKEA